MDSFADAFGFAAAAATLTTFAQARMVPMRIAAITSNVLFIVYGTLGAFYPVLLLHLLLFPVNAWRLSVQLRGTRKYFGKLARAPLLEAWRQGMRSDAPPCLGAHRPAFGARSVMMGK
jgi:CRP/FNR family transcriptional regulator, cyclic AMP receptor protein